MLIPTVVALSSFFASNFPNISWYPYWYLGNPYQYLIGPIVPLLLTLLKALKLPLYESYLFLIGLGLFLGALGVFLLLKEFGVGKRQAVFSAVLYLILPGSFYLLNFQNGLNHIAFGVVPFILLLYRRFLALHLRGVALNHFAVLSLLIAFALLINVSILLTLIIGFTALFFTLENKRDWEDLVIKSVLIVLLGISLASIWYTPKFWWILLSNPSFGGVPLFNLITSLFKLLLNLLPVVLAVIFVKWRRYKPKGYLLFAVLFFSSFLFLSIVRFLSDPDFMIDWMGFGLELQFGGAVILGSFLGKFKIQNYSSKFKITVQNSKFLVSGIVVVALIVASWVPAIKMWPKGSSSEYQNRIISMLKTVPSDERVFLSGSPVFFIDSHLDINQVRGGVDQASIHPFWAHGAYQIREGQDAEVGYDWLTALGASYILVHQNNSKDIFHDFRNTKRFFDQNYFDSIVEENGDQLYKVKGASIARIADEKILKVPKPKNGADNSALSEYVGTIKRPVNFSYQKASQVQLSGSTKRDEVFSLAITFDPRWKVIEGRGRIVSDALENMVIIPKEDGEQFFTVSYGRFWYDRWIPVFLSVVLLIILINFQKIFLSLKPRLPRLSIGWGDEEEY